MKKKSLSAKKIIHKSLLDYLKNKPMSPKNENWDKALEYWSQLKSDDDVSFDKEISLEQKI